ncbi:hypothetical protein [Methylocystis silviterrae]|uniref:hypothetical protein n=1 Tax=Methylocystis silviterrae TaxID=2743612 RepID=UPI003C768C54
MDYRRTNYTAGTGSFALDYCFGWGGGLNTVVDGIGVIGGVSNDLSFLHDLTINSKNLGFHLNTAGHVVALGEAAFRASEGDYSGSADHLPIFQCR